MAQLRDERLKGFAIIEGVYMTSETQTAYAVRNVRGDVSVRLDEREEGEPLIASIPFLRGWIRFFACIIRFFAANRQALTLKPCAPEQGNRFEARFATLFRIRKETNVARLSMIKVLVCAALLLVGFPKLMVRIFSEAEWAIYPVLDGISALSTVLGLMAFIRCMSHTRILRRYCMMQTAVNKVLNADVIYNGTITAGEVRTAPSVCAHSDGAFLLWTLILSCIIGAYIPAAFWQMRVPLRLGIFAAVAAVWNELYLPMERASVHSFLAMVRVPVVNLQKLWLRKCDADMIRIALCAYDALKQD